MSKERFTKGEWLTQFVSGCCIGVGSVQEGAPKGYVVMICNSILPETDKEYKKEEPEILANMRLMAASKNMYEALDGTVKYLIELAAAFDNETSFKATIFKRIDKIKAALAKANPQPQNA